MRALARGLSARGYPSTIAAPADTSAEYPYDELPVYRFRTDRRKRLELAYGVPDEVAAQGFKTIVERVRPAMVHLHARTSAISERLVDIAHEFGARVIFTYHTPTASCVRGTMMLFGERPCDGVIDRTRCTACAISALGMPRSIARAAAAVPEALSARASGIPSNMKPFSYSRIPGLLATACRRLPCFIAKVDHVIAVCRWVRDVLERNGVPSAKITLLRHGISQQKQTWNGNAACEETSPLRIAYFGRSNRAKGVDLLVEALALMPHVELRLDLYLVRQPGDRRDFRRIVRQAKSDSRIRVQMPVSPDRVGEIMARYQLIAVPSRGLETGPLVVLEAFSAGVPVLGANHGGIAELVRDGIDGILFAPGNVRALSDALTALATEPALVGSSTRKRPEAPLRRSRRRGHDKS